MPDWPTSTVVVHDAPDPASHVEPAGPLPRTVFHVDWPTMGQPSPPLIHDIQQVQTTLAACGTVVVDPAVQSAYDAAMDGVNDLVRALVEARAADLRGEGDSLQLLLGNLEVLPAVEKEIEHVPVDGDGEVR